MIFRDRFDSNRDGVWFFFPHDEAAYRRGETCKGFGCVRYAEGSVYTGDLLFDGGRYLKVGHGQQEFSRSRIGVFRPQLGLRYSRFVGEFDERETGWMCGNGTLYYTDEAWQPLCFVRGVYEGLHRTGDWVGELGGTLLDGYTPEMERVFDLRDRIYEKEWESAKDLCGAYSLFIGDSYYELWTSPAFAGEGKTFYELFSPETHLNVGVGGSTYRDWVNSYARLFSRAPYPPARIFLHAGFNDLHHHAGFDYSEQVYADFLELLGILRENFPSAEVIVDDVCAAPNYPHAAEAEEKLNALLRAGAEAGNYRVLPLRERLAAAQREKNRYAADGIHPNPYGYEIMYALVRGEEEK